MNPIHGKDAILRILKSGTYVPVACVTEFTFYSDKETIETTTADTALYRSYIPAMQSWGVSLSGVSFISETDFYTVIELIEKQIQGELLSIEIAYSDDKTPTPNLSTITGQVLLPHLDMVSPQIGFTENRIEMQGSGALQIDNTLINPVTVQEVENEEYTAIGGESSITIPALANREILEFSWAGIARQVITVGTPNDSQVKYIASTGTFDLPFAALAGDWILILWK